MDSFLALIFGNIPASINGFVKESIFKIGVVFVVIGRKIKVEQTFMQSLTLAFTNCHYIIHID